MFSSPDTPTTLAAALLGGNLTGVPSGPRGLWGALVEASSVHTDERRLPVTTLHGPRTASVMFDYDPGLAVALEDDSLVA